MATPQEKPRDRDGQWPGYRGSYVTVQVMVTDWFGTSTVGEVVHVTTEASGPLLVLY
jgi:hypothetical protein